MIYSDTTTKQGLVQDTLFWADTDLNGYPIEDLTRSINFALDKYTAIIIGSDQRWQWDDTNNTNNPIGSADLVSGQGLYGLDSTMLTIERVEVADSNGNWTKLENFDRDDTDQAMDEFMKTNGIPRYYDKKAESIQLYPAPNYSATVSLKIYFSRALNHFATTDTSKAPGFAQPFHRLLSLSAAVDYCVTYKKDRVALLESKLFQLEKELVKFYSHRNEDRTHKLQPKMSNRNGKFGRRFFNNSDLTARI